MYEGKRGAKRLLEALLTASYVESELYDLAEVLYYDVDQLREDIKALEEDMTGAGLQSASGRSSWKTLLRPCATRRMMSRRPPRSSSA